MSLNIYVDQIDSHVHIRVFMNGGLAGKLILQTEELGDFLDELHLKLQRLYAECTVEHVFECSPENRSKLDRLIFDYEE